MGGRASARDSLDAIETVDDLVHRGVDVGAVGLVNGRLARSRSQASVSSSDDVGLTADWFS
jgi:hypothetical protein